MTSEEACEVLKGSSSAREQMHALESIFLTLDTRAASCALPMLDDMSKTLEVRAFAIEVIGNVFERLPSSDPRYGPMADVLLSGLTSQNVEIRFWSCYAVANLRVTAALPALAKLAAGDQAMCPGMWTVAEEAKDAIYCIGHDNWPEQTRVPGLGSGQFP